MRKRTGSRWELASKLRMQGQAVAEAYAEATLLDPKSARQATIVDEYQARSGGECEQPTFGFSWSGDSMRSTT